MRTTTVAALILALTAGSSIAEAQPPRRDANMRGANAPGADRARPATQERGRMDNAMRGRRAMSPAAALLRQRERLALTAEQTARLETLAVAQREALAVSPSQRLRLRADLMDATGRNANPTAARAALDKMSAERNTRIVAAMQAREQARAVLTPAQLSTIEHAGGARRGMRAGKADARRGGAARGPQPTRPPQGPRPPRG